jgi:hypothetical protein
MSSLETIFSFLKEAKKFNDVNKNALQKQIYQNRWKNLFLSLVYLLFFSALLLVGLWKKNYFSIFQWYIFVSSIIFFSAIGLFTFLNYVYIIVKKK